MLLGLSTLKLSQGGNYFYQWLCGSGGFKALGSLKRVGIAAHLYLLETCLIKMTLCYSPSQTNLMW